MSLFGRENDFTRGSLAKSILIFVIPVFLSEFLQSLYNSADAVVVGRYVGSEALAAVSVSSPLVNLFVGFFTGMATGATAVVGHAYGERRELKNIVGAIVSFSVTIGIVMSMLGFVFSKQLIGILNPPGDVFNEAHLYFRIYILGLIFSVLYNILSGILRALGDSASALMFVCCSTVLNIVLDILLVKGFSLGVRGVAYATISAQAATAVLAAVRLYNTVHYGFIDFRKEKACIRKLLVVGMPTGIQYSLTALSNMFVWRSIGSFDAAAIAGVGVTQKIDHFVTCVSKAFGAATTTAVAQNTGAGNAERCRRSVRITLMTGIAMTLGIGSLLYLFANPITALYSTDSVVVRIASEMLVLCAPFYIFVIVRQVLVSAQRGKGDAAIPSFLSLLGMIGVRQLFLVTMLHRAHEMVYVYWCYPVGWVSAAVFTSAYYLLRKKRYEL